MGISVVLESWQHKAADRGDDPKVILRRLEALGRVDDPHMLLNGLLPSSTSKEFRCIAFIDPYGNTVFNQLQMPEFLEEWERAKEAAKPGRERELMEAVARLAEQCRDGVHLYLAFYGD